MSTNSVQDGIEKGACAPQQVSISRWVNEPYPAWGRILTAHDVARLIRRPPWMIRSLAAVGQLPKRQRFRGKKIGWLKADILDWIARTSRYWVATPPDKANGYRRRRSDSPGQQRLPLRCAAARTSDGHSTESSIAGVSS
jgi:hypothetical protein